MNIDQLYQKAKQQSNVVIAPLNIWKNQKIKESEDNFESICFKRGFVFKHSKLNYIEPMKNQEGNIGEQNFIDKFDLFIELEPINIYIKKFEDFNLSAEKLNNLIEKLEVQKRFLFNSRELIKEILYHFKENENFILLSKKYSYFYSLFKKIMGEHTK